MSFSRSQKIIKTGIHFILATLAAKQYPLSSNCIYSTLSLALHFARLAIQASVPHTSSPVAPHFAALPIRHKTQPMAFPAVLCPRCRLPFQELSYFFAALLDYFMVALSLSYHLKSALLPELDPRLTQQLSQQIVALLIASITVALITFPILGTGSRCTALEP